MVAAFGVPLTIRKTVIGSSILITSFLIPAYGPGTSINGRSFNFYLYITCSCFYGFTPFLMHAFLRSLSVLLRFACLDFISVHFDSIT